MYLWWCIFQSLGDQWCSGNTTCNAPEGDPRYSCNSAWPPCLRMQLAVTLYQSDISLYPSCLPSQLKKFLRWSMSLVTTFDGICFSNIHDQHHQWNSKEQYLTRDTSVLSPIEWLLSASNVLCTIDCRNVGVFWSHLFVEPPPWKQYTNQKLL